MNCEELKGFIYRYLDKELDEEQIALVNEHLEKCPLCQLQAEKEQHFNALIKNHIPKNSAPYALREKIVGSLEKPDAFSKFNIFQIFRPVTASIISLCLLMVMGYGVMRNYKETFPMFSTSVTRHMDYLKGGYPLEIVSSDTSEIKQWLEGKLDFAVHMPDLPRSGFTVKGARLCHLKEQKVAYLMLEKGGEDVSLFILDTQGLGIPKSDRFTNGSKTFYVKNINGYNSILCIDEKTGSTGCLFVTMLSQDDVLRLMV